MENNEREKSSCEKRGVFVDIEYYRSRENEKAEGWSVGTAVITRRMSQTDAWCCQVVWDIFIIRCIIFRWLVEYCYK